LWCEATTIPSLSFNEIEWPSNPIGLISSGPVFFKSCVSAVRLDARFQPKERLALSPPPENRTALVPW